LVNEIIAVDLTVLAGKESAHIRVVPSFPKFTRMPSTSAEALSTFPDVRPGRATVLGARERRRRARVQVHWPLFFLLPDVTRSIETVTENLSSDGFYCVANRAFVPGEVLSCVLSVPTHNPNGGEQIRAVRCWIRVIRVESLTEDGSYGVGCRIEDYRFVTNSGREDSLPAMVSPFGTE